MGTLGRRWTRFDLAEAQRLYADGATCQQIADKQNLSRTYVSTQLRNAGTAMRPVGRPRHEVIVNVDRLVRLREAGMSWRRLSEYFHVTRHAARAAYLRAVGCEGECGGIGGGSGRVRAVGEPSPERSRATAWPSGDEGHLAGTALGGELVGGIGVVDTEGVGDDDLGMQVPHR